MAQMIIRVRSENSTLPLTGLPPESVTINGQKFVKERPSELRPLVAKSMHEKNEESDGVNIEIELR